MINRNFLLYFSGLFACLMMIYPAMIQPSTADIVVEVKIVEGIEQLSEEEQKYIQYITKYINGNEMSVPLVLAIMKAESNFKIKAKSHKGALGLMQLMPRTALAEYRMAGVDTSSVNLKRQLLKQPELNIVLGVKHLQRIQDRLDGIENTDMQRMLVVASYNAGIHRVKRAFNCRGFTCYKYKANRYGNRYFKKSIRSLPRETRDYLKRVEANYHQYKQILTQKETAIAETA